MRIIFLPGLLLAAITFSHAQPVAQKLDNAIKALIKDSSLKHAITGFCVTDSKTGNIVYEYNSQVGLAVASTQKLFTSGAAFELLGNQYRYKTLLGYSGKLEDSVIKGDLYITGTGDPTFGSWRWTATNEETILHAILAAVKNIGIKEITGRFNINNKNFSAQAIPGGWIWDDIGNYYGAGAYALNWRENQFDLELASGKKIGDKVAITGGRSYMNSLYINELTSAKKGSGDNAYIYLSTERSYPLLKGTIPVDEKDFKISGAIPNPAFVLNDRINDYLGNNGVRFTFKGGWTSYAPFSEVSFSDTAVIKPIITFFSPTLDSINYWFLKRSINLYGEALVKTIAYEKTGYGSTEKGVELVKDFWQQHGIEKSAINIIDGSGLSPQNRVTADALVKVLLFAKTRPWFNSFYYDLPEYNGMKMKSGSIGGARAFAGYQLSSEGKEYSFAIIVNNYDGPSGEVVKKMYRVLDVLK